MKNKIRIACIDFIKEYADKEYTDDEFNRQDIYDLARETVRELQKRVDNITEFYWSGDYDENEYNKVRADRVGCQNIGVIDNYTIWGFSKQVERISEDVFEIHDTTDGWNSYEVSLAVLKKVITGELDYFTYITNS